MKCRALLRCVLLVVSCAVTIHARAASPPALLSASSRGNPNGVTLIFSEAMDPASALVTLNYQVNPSVTVTGASFGSNNAIVRLQTSTLIDGTNYTVTVSQVQDADGETISPNPTNAAFTHGAEYPRFRVLNRRFDNILGGGEVARLLTNAAFPNAPSSVAFRSFFEIPPNAGTYYGSQLIGFYVAPSNGFYKFWMCSDDQGLTYLATDANPAHKQIIAAEPIWNASRDYGTLTRRNAANPENRTNLAQLVAGQRVYLEAVSMEFDGDDNLSVAVQLPGVAAVPTVPIASTNFAEMRLYSNVIFQTVGPVVIVSGPENPLTVQAKKRGIFSAVLDGTPPWFMQWYSNNVPIVGATNLTHTTPVVAYADAGTVYYFTASNEFSGAVSPQRALVVAPPDPSPPTVLSVSSRGNPNGVTLTFSEPMDPGTALFTANYQINRGVTVLSASFGASNSVVQLQTSTLLEGTNYTVTVSQVRDAENEVLAPNPTNVMFTHGAEFSKFRVMNRRYLNVPGVAGDGSLARLTSAPAFPDSPSATFFPTLFEIAQNVADNYGAQLFGYYVAPSNGLYKFWMCSDQQGATYLATDANPAHKQLIASEPIWNASRDYTTTTRRDPFVPENRSSFIALSAGQRVYLEGLMMEGSGDDNLSVAVQLPGEVNPPTVPIAATNFAETRLFSNTIFQTFGPITILSAPESTLTVKPQQRATFSVVLDGTPPWFTQWFSNNVPIPGATNLSFTTAPVAFANDGDAYHVVVSNEFSSAVSAQGIIYVVSEPLPGLVAWWPGEGNPNDVASGHPTTSYNPGYTNGVAGQAFSFNGTSAYLDAGTTADFIPTNFSMSFWMNARVAAGVLGSHWGIATGNPNTWIFNFGSDRRLFFSVQGVDLAHPTAVGTRAFPLNEWHYIVGTYDGAIARVYLDGQLEDQKAGDIVLRTGITSIGALRDYPGGSVNSFFNGAMDEVEFYNRVLSPNEIQARFDDAAEGRYRSDLTVGIIATPDPVVVTSNLTYVINVTNLGPQAVDSVMLSNFLPATVDFVSAVSSVGSCHLDGGVVTCEFGTLSNLMTAMVTLQVMPTASGFLYTHATVRGAGLDPFPANNNAVARPRAVREPIITTQPAPVSVPVGGTVTLTAIAFGAPPLQFQWRLNGVNIPNETNSTLTIPSAQAINAGSYTVVAYNDFGAVNSIVAGATVQITALNGADYFSNRVSLVGASGLIRGTSTGASREAGEPNHAGKIGGKSVWYLWSPPANGIATVHLLGSAFDTLLGVYTGTDVAALTEVGSDEDRGDFLTSKVLFNAVAGTSYAVALDGFADSSGEYVLRWSLETTADTLPVITLQPQGQVILEGSNATFTVAATGADLGYQWFLNSTSLKDETNTSLTISNAQAIHVGNYSARITNAAGRVVVSRIAALELSTSPTDLTQAKFEDLPPGAPDARRSKAVSVAAGTVVSQTFSTVGATTQLHETNHCETLGGSSKWLALVATTDGIMQLDTLGSDFDTLMAVYRGTSLLDLTMLACDNNSAPDGIRSLVRFPVVHGLEYRVVVDGVRGTQGVARVNGRLGFRPVVTTPTRIPVAGLNQPLVLTAGVTNATADLLFFWRLNGFGIPGATNATLAIGNLVPANAGVYSVVISNFTGLITNIAAVVSAVGYDGSSLGNSQGRFRIMGYGAQPLLFETSSNFMNWNPWRTNAQPGPFDYSDPETTNFLLRFYRVTPR